MHCPRITSSPLATAEASRSGQASRFMVTSEPDSELRTQTLGSAATSRRARGAHRRSCNPATSRPGYGQIEPPSGFEVISGQANAPTVLTHQATTANQPLPPSRLSPDTVAIRRQHREDLARSVSPLPPPAERPLRATTRTGPAPRPQAPGGRPRSLKLDAYQRMTRRRKRATQSFFGVDEINEMHAPDPPLPTERAHSSRGGQDVQAK